MSVSSAIGLFSSPNIPVPYPSPTITSQVGTILPWVVVANATQDTTLVSNAPIGFYTLTWQGQLINTTGCSASLFSMGVYQGNPVAVIPTKFPVINLTNIDSNLSPNFYYTGGSVSFYNAIVQDIGWFRTASSDFVDGGSGATWNINSYTLIKQNYTL